VCLLVRLEDMACRVARRSPQVRDYYILGYLDDIWFGQSSDVYCPGVRYQWECRIAMGARKGSTKTKSTQYVDRAAKIGSFRKVQSVRVATERGYVVLAARTTIPVPLYRFRAYAHDARLQLPHFSRTLPIGIPISSIPPFSGTHMGIEALAEILEECE
jgi:hypothetical protein